MRMLRNKTQQNFILATCVTSAVAAIIGMVSLGTEEWVSAVGYFTGGTIQSPSRINYGLFSGTYERYLLRSDFYQITMTCSADSAKCAMLCRGTSENRDRELEELVNNVLVNFTTTCPKVQRNIDMHDFSLPKHDHRTTDGKRTFIDYYLYVCTITFLALSIAVGVVAAGLSVWNTIDNPIHTVFNVLGVMVLNGTAACFASLAMIVWGIQYNITLTENAAVLDTITAEMETREPALGYSFWVNMASIVLYCASIGLLFARKMLIEKQPLPTHIQISDSNDRTIVLF